MGEELGPGVLLREVDYADVVGEEVEVGTEIFETESGKERIELHELYLWLVIVNVNANVFDLDQRVHRGMRY